jgi:hypothetical protein
MATFESNLIKKLNRHRGIYSGRPYQIAGRIILPAGTVLATSDVLLFAPIGENQRVKKVGAYINKGSLPTATASIGFHQILVDGEPAVVERLGVYGDDDTKYESPATNTTAFASAAVFSTAREVIVTGGLALAGPVNLSMTVGTGGTVGVDGVELVCYAEFDGETSERDTLGDTWNADQSYLLD